MPQRGLGKTRFLGQYLFSRLEFDLNFTTVSTTDKGQREFYENALMIFEKNRHSKSEDSKKFIFAS